jgi:hypothetical protein
MHRQRSDHPTGNLPWHVKYQSSKGTLPNITSLHILVTGVSFRIHGPFGACLFPTTDAQHAGGIFNREVAGTLTSIAIGGSITSNEACGFGARVTGRIGGTSTSLTVLNSGNRITVTLI